MATDVTAVTDPAEALAILRAEHERLCGALMCTVELLRDAQESRRFVVNADRLRQATGHMLRKSAINREAALAALHPEKELAELALAELLIDIMTDAEDGPDDDIIDLCQQRMPAIINEAVA